MGDLRAVADRVEIEALRGEFTDAVMMRDWDRLASLFTPDGAVRIPHINAEAAGREQIRAGIERLHGLLEYFVQTTHPGAIRLDGDTASGRAYICELVRFRDGRSELNYAVYHDRYRRTGDGWKFTKRVYEVRYLDTTPLAGSAPRRRAPLTRRPRISGSIKASLLTADLGGTEMTKTQLAHFDRYRDEAATRTGPASYIDTGGDGPTALFVHGVGTSSYLWRHVIAQMAGERRCVAVDLPLHGRTPAAAGQDFSLTSLARFLTDFCDATGLAEIDLVANDTGGAVAQILAAREPGWLRTLTLTNCETHDNVPPRAFLPTVLLARVGLLARMGPRLLRDLPRARRRVYGSGYQDVSRLPLEVVRAWLEPLLGTPASARQFQRWVASLHARDLLAAEPTLHRLHVPTLIVWGTGDVFFHRKWAYWLRDTIPGAAGVTEIPGAKLFFPDERATELAAALRRHWHAHVR